MVRILLVDDDEEVREEWGKSFRGEGYEVRTAGSKEEAYAIIFTEPAFEVAIVDMCLRDDEKGEDGLKVIEWLKEKNLFTQVIAVTAFMSVEAVKKNIHKAVGFGIYQYMDKIMESFFEKLLEEIGNAATHREEMVKRSRIQERIVMADRIYETQLRERLEREHKGEIVAIEISSGDFFLGKNEIEAYEKGIKKYPDETFVYKEVGEDTHFVGGFQWS